MFCVRRGFCWISLYSVIDCETSHTRRLFFCFFLGAPMYRPTTNAVLTLSYVVRLAFGTVFQPNLYKLAVLQNVRFRVCIWLRVNFSFKDTCCRCAATFVPCLHFLLCEWMIDWLVLQYSTRIVPPCLWACEPLITCSAHREVSLDVRLPLDGADE